jgi:hypothetical protein
MVGVMMDVMVGVRMNVAVDEMADVVVALPFMCM